MRTVRTMIVSLLSDDNTSNGTYKYMDYTYKYKVMSVYKDKRVKARPSK